MRIATDQIVDAEQEILECVAELPIDLHALAVASNIWRASQCFRSKVERTILQQHELSWSSFSTLFIIWVWGPIGMSAIAKHQSVSRPTVTSAVNHLQKRGYCTRNFATRNNDRRTVQVSLTSSGKALIEEVFPKFNRGEADFVNCLTQDESETLTRILRKLVNANKE